MVPHIDCAKHEFKLFPLKYPANSFLPNRLIGRGPGIEPDHRARLFERFYRVPGSNDSGAGLGLAIAKEIVVAHGGTIGVNSTPGQGSEFYFDLPAATR